MASIKFISKDEKGTQTFEVNISQGRDKPRVTKRIKVENPHGASQKTIEDRAKKMADKLEAEVKQGTLKTKKQVRAEREQMPTFKEYAEDFLKSKSLDCSAKTVEYYEHMLTHSIKAFGDKHLDEVTAKDITKMLNGVKAKYSHSTARGVYITATQIFSLAVDEDIIIKSPIKKSFAPQEIKDNKTEGVDAFSIDELSQIKRGLQTESLKWQALINFLMSTGTRRGEVVAVRWGSINWQTGAVDIVGNVVEIKGDLKINATKGGRQRTVYPSKETLHLLIDYATELNIPFKKDNNGNIVPDIDPHVFIFTQADSDKPMRPDSVTKFLSRFGNKYGIADCHPHRLRHSYATLALLNNASIQAVSSVLGHSDSAITLKVYGHSNESANQKASQTVLEVLDKI